MQFCWFNPVEILVGELLSGAQIALPSAVITVLRLLRIGSQTMYVCFMAGTVLNFILVFATYLVVRTRWFTLLISVIAGASSILLTVGAIIATIISVAAKVALTSQDQLNIRVEIGIKMFAFMWIGALLTDLAFLLHAALGCCCKPDRGQSRGQASPPAAMSEKKSMDLPGFVRRRRGAET